MNKAFIYLQTRYWYNNNDGAKWIKKQDLA